MRAAAGGGTDAFPWDQVMTAGFGLLRLSSQEFWSMTPRELAAAMRPALPPGAARPGRAKLEAMMRMFPDRGGRV